MIQEHLGIAGVNFPQHHDPTTNRQSLMGPAGYDFLPNLKGSNELFDEDADQNRLSGNNRLIRDPSKTFNYKTSSIENSAMKSLKKEAQLHTTKIGQIELPIEKGSMTQRVVKEANSDTERSAIIGKNAIKQKPSEKSLKFMPGARRKNSVSKVNLQYNLE
jgi:hypothetical protein